MAMHLHEESKMTPAGLVGRGLLAGVAGTAAMTFAQTQVLPKLRLSQIPSGYEPKAPRFPDEPEAKEEVATEVVARRLAEGVSHRRLRGKPKTWAGNLVHFGTGAAFGALLGLAAPRHLKLRHGLLYGAAVWMLNDNILLPLLRVADWPTRYPLGSHLSALAAHLVYGGGTALTLNRELR